MSANPDSDLPSPANGPSGSQLNENDPPSHDSGYEGGESRGGVGRFGWGFLILLCGYLIYRLGTLWHSNEQYSYGWFVPLLCLMLFRERWQRRPRRDPVRAASGTFLVLGLGALVLLPGALFLEVIPHWRFAGWIFAVAAVATTVIALYFIGGRSYSRHFIFPVIFFLIAVPWPSRVEQPTIETMSKLNAAASSAVANTLGTPAVRHGVLIETGTGLVGVDEACSGIRSFQASVMIGLFLGELFGCGFLRRMLLLFGGVGIAFLCNVVRTTYLVRVADLRGLDAVNLRHDTAGFMIMGVTFVGLLVLAWMMRKRSGETGEIISPVEEDRAEKGEGRREKGGKAGIGKAEMLNPEIHGQQSGSPQSETGKRQPANAELPSVTPRVWLKVALAAVVVWVAALEVGIELWFRPAERRAAGQSSWMLRFPSQSAEFKLLPLPAATGQLLACDEGTKAEWRDAQGRIWQAYYLRWAPPRNRYRASRVIEHAREHAPEVCLPLAGMTFVSDLPAAEMDSLPVPLKSSVQKFLSRGRSFHVLSAYWQQNVAGIEAGPQAQSGTLAAIKMAVKACSVRDRGWTERRVLKLGVWEMEDDTTAQAAFRELLRVMIQPARRT